MTLPLPDFTPPFVALGSGPGTGPALDPSEHASQVYLAQLSPLDRVTGQRGWELLVHRGERYTLFPHHHFSRAGSRPPLRDARDAALRALGYERFLDEEWNWQETTTLDRKAVQLFATTHVRPLQGDGDPGTAAAL